MLLLNNYFGFQLPTGGRIIGWTGLVYSLLTIMVFILDYSMYAKFLPHNQHETTEETQNIDESNEYEDMDNDNAVELTPLEMFTIFGILFLVYEIINVITSLLLLIGIKKQKHILLLPWLIEFCLTFISTLLIMFAGLFILTVTPVLSIILITILIYAMTLAVFNYSWFTVYALYTQFKNNTSPYKELLEQPLDQHILPKKMVF